MASAAARDEGADSMSKLEEEREEQRLYRQVQLAERLYCFEYFRVFRGVEGTSCRVVARTPRHGQRC